MGIILRPSLSDPPAENSNADPTEFLWPAAKVLGPPRVAGCVKGLAAGELKDCGGLKGLAMAGLAGAAPNPPPVPNPPEGVGVVDECPNMLLAVPLPPKEKGDGVGAGDESLVNPPPLNVEELGAPNPVLPLPNGVAEFGALPNGVAEFGALPNPLLVASLEPKENPVPEVALNEGPPGVCPEPPPRIGLVSIPSNSSTLVNGVLGPEGKRSPLDGGALEAAGAPNENPVALVGVGVGVAADD